MLGYLGNSFSVQFNFFTFGLYRIISLGAAKLSILTKDFLKTYESLVFTLCANLPTEF